MKKIISFLAFFLIYLPLFSFTKDDIKILTLENQLVLYFLQDTTTATVRLELNIDAGFFNQTPKDAGFFSFYAKLLGLEITPDSVKIEKTVAPPQVEDVLIQFESLFKTLQITDKNLSLELEKNKKAIREYSSSTAGFINSAIDTRIFSSSPWQSENTIMPEYFSSVNVQQARTIFAKIKNVYYVPEKTKLYISGNITEKQALDLVKKYLGKLKNSSSDFMQTKEAETLKNTEDKSLQDEKNLSTQAKKSSSVKKYVLTDDSLSPDFTQVVLQYTSFSNDETDLLASIFDNPYSTFKTLLLKQKNLALRSPDYIGVSSAQQKNWSRLLIQALCEKSNVGPLIQGELFLQMATEKQRVLQQEVDFALKEINSNFVLTCDNSTLLMKNLASFNRANNVFGEDMFAKTEKLSSLDAQFLNERYESQEPVLFVLCNTKNYAKHSKEFAQKGWIHINQKNGAWYRLSEYKDFVPSKNKNEKSLEDKIVYSNAEDFSSAKRFITENRAQFSSLKLKNEIPVTLKSNPLSKTVAISLAIEGGELLFAQNTPGLASVLTNSLAAIIQNRLDSYYANSVFKTRATVKAQTKTEYSVLTVSCSKDDFSSCMQAIFQSIVFDDISPSLADSIAYDLRSQWRIKSGQETFQLLCEAVKSIYKTPFTNLYESSKDIPSQNLEYTQIAAAYPVLLDCTRFSLVIAGGINADENLQNLLDQTFGSLQTLSKNQSIKLKIEKLPLSRTAKRVKLRHQFFTDVSADKAGPRPQVLIPTTDFSDPLLFVLDGPKTSSTDSALFSSLLYLLEKRLKEKLPAPQNIKISPPDEILPYARVSITKIKRIAETEKLYKDTVREIITALEKSINKDTSGFKELEKDSIFFELENLWLLKELEATSTNEGTAELVHQGMFLEDPLLYLQKYEAVSSAQAEDYYLIAKSYLESTKILKIYSADSKR